MTRVLTDCGPSCPGVLDQRDITICACGVWVCGTHSGQHAEECEDWVFLMDQNERNQP